MASHFHSIKPTGAVWSWGQNWDGSLGDNTTTDKSSPVAVVGSHSFNVVVPSVDMTIALKANGEAWVWGTQFSGELGINSADNKSSPVLVVGNHSFVFCGVTTDSTFGLKVNGEVWGWGNNATGQLGDNTITNRSSPVLVIGNHSFIQISEGESPTVVALKANGEVWGWGDNTSGQLGDNTRTNKSSPVQVVGNHSFILADTGNSFSLGLKENGEVWTWGSNFYGNLGDNTAGAGASKSSPVLVVGNHSFIFAVSNNYTVIGLKENGEAWTWGSNFYGTCGVGTSGSGVDKSSPVKVIGNHSFIRVAAANYTAFGLKANGEVWSWGGGSGGILGDDTTTNKASPVLVVGSHTFDSIKDVLVPSIVWGQQTTVDENHKRRFTEWRGNLVVSGTDDAEKATVDFTEKTISRIVRTGAVKVKITEGKY